MVITILGSNGLHQADTACSRNRFLLPGTATCIDCQKGIAHELPSMQGIDPGWKMPRELEDHNQAQSSPIEDLQRVISEAHYIVR